MKNYGYYVFIVTTANGSVPLAGARVSMKWGECEARLLSGSDGKTPPFTIEFSKADPPYTVAGVTVEKEGYRTLTLEGFMIYGNVTTVRIINLDRI